MIILNSNYQLNLKLCIRYAIAWKFWFRTINNAWEKTNNKFLQSIYFVLIGLKYPHFWAVFYTDFNGRDLKKMRYEFSWRKENTNAFFREIAIRQTFNIQTKWDISFNIKNIQMGEFHFKLIESFPELDSMARSLKLCSAGRQDLVDLFISGKMLRYSINKNETIIGTIAIYPSSKPAYFCFYGLGYMHLNIHKEFIEKGLDPNLLLSYQKFQNLIYDQGISYNSVKLTKKNSFNPNWNNDSHL